MKRAAVAILEDSTDVPDALARNQVLGAVNFDGITIDCLLMKLDQLPRTRVSKLLNELVVDGELEFYMRDLGGCGVPAFRRLMT